MERNNSESLYSIFHHVARFHYYRMYSLFEEYNIYPGQHGVLLILGKQGGIRQRELAEKLHIKAATITVMLNRMAKANLIERRPDPDDQRVTQVYLTQQGQKVLAKVKESLKVLETECLKDFTSEEQVLLQQLITKMRDNLLEAICAHQSKKLV